MRSKISTPDDRRLAAPMVLRGNGFGKGSPLSDCRVSGASPQIFFFEILHAIWHVVVDLLDH